MQFPYITVRRSGSQYEALCAVRLDSLLHSDLAVDLYRQGGERVAQQSSHTIVKALQKSREALLVALAAWGFATTLEIRVTSVPDLKYRAQGKIDICLVLLCQAASKNDAKEILLSRYLSLLTLLSVYSPEANWKPVDSALDFGAFFKPFTPTCAVSVHRKREALRVSTPLFRNSIGFGKGENPNSTESATLDHLYPWLASYDDWFRLLNTLTGQLDPIQLIIRLKPLAASPSLENLDKSIQTCEEFLSGQPDQRSHVRLINLLRDGYLQRMGELKEYRFAVGVFLLAANHVDNALAQVVGSAISTSRDENGNTILFKGSFTYADVSLDRVYGSDFFFDEEPFTLSEAACAFRLPSPPSLDLPGLRLKRFRTVLADVPAGMDDNPGAIKLFINDHQGVSQPVYVDADARMRHSFILGQTGTGKSALMESMIVQDIAAGKGVAVIDPHGDLCDSLINKIPKERGKDVIVFDLLDRDCPVGFNFFAWKTIDERDLIIDELYRSLDHIYDMKQTGGPIFEAHFRNFMKLLLGDKHRPGYTPTVLEFIKCYVDSKFRDWLLESITDQQVIDFIREAENVSGDASLRNVSPYITSKFSRFVNDTTLKNIIGQSRSTIDIEKIMNDGKILFIKLGKGRFGGDVSGLLANMIVGRFKFAAMKRGEIPIADRKDFFLYVDEAHNLPQENFSELLSEARKYRLGLTLSTQFCSQLGDTKGRNKNDLLSSIFGNVGTTIIFRTGMTDAEQLAKGLYPYFNQHDVINLPNFHGYARMNLANGVVRPFSFCTELCDVPSNPTLGKKIVTSSRLRYGRDVKEVAEEIKKRDQFWKEA